MRHSKSASNRFLQISSKLNKMLMIICQGSGGKNKNDEHQYLSPCREFYLNGEKTFKEGGTLACNLLVSSRSLNCFWGVCCGETWTSPLIASTAHVSSRGRISKAALFWDALKDQFKDKIERMELVGIVFWSYTSKKLPTVLKQSTQHMICSKDVPQFLN